MRSIDQIVGSTGLFPGGDADSGLSAAQVAMSRTAHGANTLTPMPREPLWRKFLGKFDEPIIHILLAAALLSTVVDLFKASQSFGWIGLGALAALLGPVIAVSRLRQWIPSLMLVAAIVLCGLSFVGGHPSFEGLAVMVAVVLATGVAFYSELKSDREFEVLNATKDQIRVKVHRDGRFQTIGMDEVVVGDVVLLEAGDEVPADGRLITAVDLSIDQSLMTGESEAVKKSAGKAHDTAEGPDQPSCVYRGTQVVDGIGTLMVCDVGDATMVGGIARTLSEDGGDDDGDGGEEGPATREERVRERLTISKKPTPLQGKLKHLADLITYAGYTAAALIFVAMVVKGYIDGEFTDALSISSVFLGAVVYAVIIVVVAVPEGLPMSVTVSLAMAMRKMTRANSLVRQLVACETIGSATVICSDKTGTMTKNQMSVVRVGEPGKLTERGGAGWQDLERRMSKDHEGKSLEWIVLNAAVNSTAQLEPKEGRLVVVGSGTEGALLFWLEESKVSFAAARDRNPVLYQMHFSSERKSMTTVIRQGNSAVVLVKGASEVILDQSEFRLNEKGDVVPWTVDEKQAVREEITRAAGAAMRTLAFAHRTLAPSEPTDMDGLHAHREALGNGLVFDGFVAIRDPLRDDVVDAVRSCREAGIDVKMVTGDNIETARAIGYDVGLLASPQARVLTSSEFAALSDAQAREMLPNLAILARARPLDKFRLVKLLQDGNEVVAVTGDGTNDAPALKRADVGLAMGISGTEVAKEASKIVLLDDAFSTIVKAVHWGRALYENIQRFIQFQLTINVSALVIAFLAPFFGIRPPFTVLQLLWINVIMDTFASIALCSEPPRDGLMQSAPKRRDESIVTGSMWWSIMTTSAFYVVVMMALLIFMKGSPGQPGFLGETGDHVKWMVETSGGKVEQLTPNQIAAESTEGARAMFTMRQVTIFFTVYVLFQVWNMINCRSLSSRVSGLSNLAGNPNLVLIATLIVGFQIILVQFLGALFNTEPLTVVEWALIALATSSVLVFGEIVRLVGGNRSAQRSFAKAPMA